MSEPNNNDEMDRLVVSCRGKYKQLGDILGRFSDDVESLRVVDSMLSSFIKCADEVDAILDEDQNEGGEDDEPEPNDLDSALGDETDNESNNEEDEI